MTVTAPPRPPETGDSFQHNDPNAVIDPEALIEEARQRTRARRRRYAALALAAAAGLGLYFGLAGGGGTSAQPSDTLASPPAPVTAYPGYFELWFIRGDYEGGCCMTFPTWRAAAQLGISPDEDIHTRREINGPDENRRATDLLERVLTSLIAGPTPADHELLAKRARDLGVPKVGAAWTTSIPPNTQLLGVTLSNGIATIDIASEPLYPLKGNEWVGADDGFDYLEGGPVGIEFVFAQLVLTATEFPFVKGVLFKLDGQPVKAQLLRPYAVWDNNPDNYELVGRPVTRADYEGTRWEDAVSRQGPGT